MLFGISIARWILLILAIMSGVSNTIVFMINITRVLSHVGGDHYSRILLSLFGAVGAILAVAAFFGAICENRWLMGTYAVVIIFVCIGTYAVLLLWKAIDRDYIQEMFYIATSQPYNAKTARMKLYFDHLQSKNGCCGLVNSRDWGRRQTRAPASCRYNQSYVYTDGCRNRINFDIAHYQVFVLCLYWANLVLQAFCVILCAIAIY